MSTAEQTVSSAGGAVADAANASRWQTFRDIPLRLSVDITLPSMSLRSLGALQPGQVLPSLVSTADDLTVVIAGAPVCLARFEYMDGRMSIRMTRLLGTPSGGVAGMPTPPATAAVQTGAGA